jgi:hypothetical protein
LHRAVAAGRGAGRALSEVTDCPQHRRRGTIAIAHPSGTSNPRGTDAFRADTGEKEGGRRSSMPRSAHPSATIFGFGTAKHGNRRRQERSRQSARGTGPAQLRSQAAKAAERWLGGGAAFGRLQLHGVMVAAHRSLRGKRQSRQPPCRSEAGMVGGFAA